MSRVKFVIVFLCLVNFAELVPLRKLYYSNPNDPNAIAFEGQTNYDTRKSSENEVEENIIDLINVRLNDGGFTDVSGTIKPPHKEPESSGFFFPED